MHTTCTTKYKHMNAKACGTSTRVEPSGQPNCIIKMCIHEQQQRSQRLRLCCFYEFMLPSAHGECVSVFLSCAAEAVRRNGQLYTNGNCQLYANANCTPTCHSDQSVGRFGVLCVCYGASAVVCAVRVTDCIRSDSGRNWDCAARVCAFLKTPA